MACNREQVAQRVPDQDRAGLIPPARQSAKLSAQLQCVVAVLDTQRFDQQTLGPGLDGTGVEVEAEVVKGVLADHLRWSGKASAPLFLGGLVTGQLTKGLVDGMPKLEALIAKQPERFK